MGWHDDGKCGANYKAFRLYGPMARSQQGMCFRIFFWPKDKPSEGKNLYLALPYWGDRTTLVSLSLLGGNNLELGEVEVDGRKYVVSAAGHRPIGEMGTHTEYSRSQVRITGQGCELDAEAAPLGFLRRGGDVGGGGGGGGGHRGSDEKDSSNFENYDFGSPVPPLGAGGGDAKPALTRIRKGITISGLGLLDAEPTVHTLDKKDNCALCGDLFQKSRLNHAFLHSPTGGAPFVCMYPGPGGPCKFEADSRSSWVGLDMHRLLKHPECNTFECVLPACPENMTFTRQAVLEHMENCEGAWCGIPRCTNVAHKLPLQPEGDMDHRKLERNPNKRASHT
jgi:hypothetical protein